MQNTTEIDISENRLRNRGRVLDILLSMRNTKQNIIWATDSYTEFGRGYWSNNQVKKEQITGGHGTLIRPRAAKSKEEQKIRTKDKAEVFTPLKVVKEMNMAIDWLSKNYPVDKDNWLDYISELRLEITCGEGPFIAGRYNPISSSGVIVKPHSRVGFLDRKLQKVNKFASNKADWLKYAELALKSSYGYEWQGDNLLIARENILLTIDDFYRVKFKVKNGLTTKQLESFAEIISWNFFQMDGLKYVKPMSCRKDVVKPSTVQKNQTRLLPIEKAQKIQIKCEGCRLGNPLAHSGEYAVVMDWQKNKKIKFVKLVSTKVATLTQD